MFSPGVWDFSAQDIHDSLLVKLCMCVAVVSRSGDAAVKLSQCNRTHSRRQTSYKTEPGREVMVAERLESGVAVEERRCTGVLHCLNSCQREDVEMNN